VVCSRVPQVPVLHLGGFEFAEGGLANSGTEGTFSDICLTRLLWLIMIRDFQGKGNFQSFPPPNAFDKQASQS
jgi:hypothetical protein